MSDVQHMSVDEYNKLILHKPSRSKYGNVKVVIDGVTFDSKAEAARYQELKRQQADGAITELVLQPKFLLIHAFRDGAGKFHRKTEYVGDFQYVNENGIVTVEDVKGGSATQTAVFRLKWKMAINLYMQLSFVIVQ